MKRILLLIALAFYVVLTTSSVVYSFMPLLDYKYPYNNGSDICSYICEVGSYKACFGLDITSIPDNETLLKASFYDLIAQQALNNKNQSLIYKPSYYWIFTHSNYGNSILTDPVGFINDHQHQLIEFHFLDKSNSDIQNELSEKNVSLTITSPKQGSNINGTIRKMKSSQPVSLKIKTYRKLPAPDTILLASIGIGLIGWMRRRALA